MAGTLRLSTGISFSKMRVLGSYALVYLTRGSGCYQIGIHESRLCKAGDLLIVFPELAHAYGPGPGEVWDEIYLVFEGAVFDLWRQSGLLSPERPVLRLSAVQPTAEALRQIISAKGVGRPNGTLRAVCLLQTFLAEAIARQRASRQDSGHSSWPSWVEAAVARMEAEPDISLESLAFALGLSYESFRKKFRTITGISPAAFRHRIGMDLARRWMYEQGLTNKEIADRLGFCDEFHFSRRFSQMTGQTTREFRRSLPGKGTSSSPLPSAAPLFRRAQK
jgi:AraC-like DNA-binding protein